VWGTISPGASIGTLTMNLGSTSGTIAMALGAEFKFELGAPGASIDAYGSSDQIRLTGAAASDFSFNGNVIDFRGTGTTNGFYKLFDTDFAISTTWTGLTVDGTGLITAGLSATNIGAGLTGELIMGGGSTYGGDAGDIYLLIPESSSALLGSIGALCLLRRRRNA